MSEHARVCQSMPECAGVCQSKPEYASVCQSMQENARVCQSMPEYARVCQRSSSRPPQSDQANKSTSVDIEKSVESIADEIFISMLIKMSILKQQA